MRHIADLQDQIQRFMEFLLQISRIINTTVKHSDSVYEVVQDKGSFGDVDIKKVSLVCS